MPTMIATPSTLAQQLREMAYKIEKGERTGFVIHTFVGLLHQDIHCDTQLHNGQQVVVFDIGELPVPKSTIDFIGNTLVGR